MSASHTINTFKYILSLNGASGYNSFAVQGFEVLTPPSMSFSICLLELIALYYWAAL